MIASLCWALHVAPRDLIGDSPEAYDPAMLATLINYGNWKNDRQRRG
jgi:hypothetical protein